MCPMQFSVEVGGLDTFAVSVGEEAKTVGDLKVSVRETLEVDDDVDLYLNDVHLKDDEAELAGLGLAEDVPEGEEPPMLTASSPELYAKAKQKRLEAAIEDKQYELIGILGAVGVCEKPIADNIIASFDDEPHLTAMVDALGRDCPTALNGVGAKRKTALGMATEQQRVDIVKKLLDAGASPNMADMLKMTPLRLAVDRQYEEIFNLLVDAKADPDMIDLSKKTALHYAAERGASAMVKRLLDDRNASVGFVDINGRTPLYYASEKGHEEIVSMLLKAGADPNKTDRFGNAPLHFAAERGYHGIAGQLLKAGADTDPKDSDEKAPLHLAAAGGHAKMALLLLRHNKGSVDAKDEVGRTPLDVAKLEGQAEMVVILEDPEKALNPPPPAKKEKKKEGGCVIM